MALHQNAKLNTTNLRKVCNQTADSYVTESVVAREIGRRLLNRLAIVRLKPKKVLDLGCADGWLTEQLAEQFPDAEVTGIDWASERLPKSPSAANIKYLTADMHDLPFAAKSFDLIVANLTLEWSPEWAKVLGDLYQLAAPGGLLHFATASLDTLKELRQAWLLVDQQYPHVHPLLDMHHLGDELLKQGFQDPVMDMETLTCLYRSPEHLFAELKANGVQNQLIDQRPTLTGKKRFQQFCQMLNEGKNADGKIPMTFEVTYGHTWKPVAGAKSTTSEDGKTVRVDIESIKRK